MPKTGFVAAYLGLLLLQPLWHGLAHRDHPGVVIAVTVPLLVPLIGLFKDGGRAIIWACYLTIFYFTYAISELIVAQTGHWLATAAIGLCVICYTAMLGMAARARAQRS